jgi:hypothetical protein
VRPEALAYLALVRANNDGCLAATQNNAGAAARQLEEALSLARALGAAQRGLLALRGDAAALEEAAVQLNLAGAALHGTALTAADFRRVGGGEQQIEGGPGGLT